MKKLCLIFFSLLMVSCASSKLVGDSYKTLKGEWTLNSVTYSDNGIYKTTLLNDATKQCFEGSNWQFVPNNNTGTYTINNSDCTTGVRYFNFSLQEMSNGTVDFMLKPTDKKHNPDTNQGFRLTLTQLSTSTMQLQQAISVNGSPLKINMNFTKK
ncbi:lipocalin family protein [Tenacibaculum sp. IB213877]|uniref:lipocalin family protein n=1 Tax=Tenacibaculum sp. IB213877 TaxID=3097351 RepID=UPI002A5A35C4|nr:lipocalin family protein [Tenacibaculum sp. IB213877]MDY0781210.1 lipocalin family protein [Tenacibaculum sp. IB213877]